MPGNAHSVSAAIDQMVESLGLEKLAAGEPEGESAGVVADPGTSHPAEQGTDGSNIQSASGGSMAAEHATVQKEEVPGTSTAESNPEEANNSGADSSSENATSASYVGEKKDSYTDSAYDPGTSHPADVNKNPEKYSAQLIADANFLVNEIEKMAAEDKTDYAGDAYEADIKLKKAKAEDDDSDEEEEKEAKAEGDGEVTVADRISELMLGKKASTEVERDLSVNQAISKYLSGYVKSASLIGALTADFIDAQVSMQKYANEEMGYPEEEMAGMGAMGAMPEGADMMGAEELEAGAGGEADADAAALAAAAEEVAAELGVSPEEVLEAAMAEAEGLEAGGGEGLPEEAAMGGVPAEEDMMEEAAIAEGDEGLDEEKMAAAIDEMAKKARAYDELMYKRAQDEQNAAQADTISKAVVQGMQQWFNQVQPAGK